MNKENKRIRCPFELNECIYIENKQCKDFEICTRNGDALCLDLIENSLIYQEQYHRLKYKIRYFEKDKNE